MKNPFYLSLILLSVITLVSCTKLEMEEDLPEVETLTHDSIVTSLDRVNIIADADSLELLLTPYKDLLVSAEINYYSPLGQLLSNEPAFIEIKGRGSADFPAKPFGVHFSAAIDNSSQAFLPTQILGAGHHLNQLRSIRLRNSGQDFEDTMIKDLAYSLFVIESGMDLDIKYGKPVHVFLNDSYYGLFNLRSENNQVAIADLLNINPEEVTVAKIDPDNERIEHREGNPAKTEALLEAIEEEDAAALKTLLDIENFMDYLILEDYIGNVDWPHNNVSLYSAQGAPFRFFFFDADLVGFRPRNARLPELEYLEDDISVMFQILMEDDHFLEQLEERQKYWYARFSPDTFNAIVDELANNIKDDIPYAIAKWETPNSTLQWRLNIAQMKRDFERTDHFNRRKYDFD